MAVLLNSFNYCTSRYRLREGTTIECLRPFIAGNLVTFLSPFSVLNARSISCVNTWSPVYLPFRLRVGPAMSSSGALAAWSWDRSCKDENSAWTWGWSTVVMFFVRLEKDSCIKYCTIQFSWGLVWPWCLHQPLSTAAIPCHYQPWRGLDGSGQGETAGMGDRLKMLGGWRFSRPGGEGSRPLGVGVDSAKWIRRRWGVGLGGD